MGKHATIELQDPGMIRKTTVLKIILTSCRWPPRYWWCYWNSHSTSQSTARMIKQITSCLKKSTLIKDNPPSNSIMVHFSKKKHQKTSICKASLNTQTPKKNPRPAKRALDSETKENNPSEDTPREAVHLMVCFVRLCDGRMMAFTSLSWL